MNKETAQKTYQQLLQKATQAANAYYNTDTQLITDDEYDTIIDSIQTLETKYGWSEATQLLTQVAGGTSTGGDVTHQTRMLSLSKVNTIPDLTSFLTSMNKTVGKETECILEPKLDGLAVSIKYNNGKITQVALRGNGTTGENITNRFPTQVNGIPTVVPNLEPFEVRGEIFITHKDFITTNINRATFEFNKWWDKQKTLGDRTKTYNHIIELIHQNEPGTDYRITGDNTVFSLKKVLFVNSRNAVAGTLRKGEQDYVTPMSFAAYDAMLPGSETRNYTETLETLKDYGFRTANQLIPTPKTPLTLIEQVERFGEIRKNPKYPIPTDGVVVKANSPSVRALLGEGSKHPRWAVAYKYPSTKTTTVVQDIETNIGRTGRLTLRAKVAPVFLDGTLISYASLHNVSWVEQKDIRIGDTVTITRANDVIPYIDAPVMEKRPQTATKWEAPPACPNCGETWDKSTLLWRCPNPACGQLNSIIHAAGRDYFDWEGLSEAIITRLNDTGLVKNIADVFALTREDLATLDMGRGNNQDGTLKTLGPTVGNKIFDQIQKSKTRPLPAVLAALGIRTLGRSVGRWLVDEYGNMADILKATPADLTRIEGIASTKANLIADGLKQNHHIIKQLAEHGVTMIARKPTTTTSALAGKKICITGAVPGFTRGQLQELLAQQGAKPSSSVSANTDLLVADENSHTSSKYKKAEQLGTKIITPEQFLGMLA